MHISNNLGLGAGIIRMYFYDCFLKGCDASMLLDSTPGNSSEKEHPANNPSMRGPEVINEAKARIETLFTIRDSSYKLGRIKYAIPAGRRDGHVSICNQVSQNLPPPSFNSQQLIGNFVRKGMPAEEMVSLSGAHSIGISRCFSFSNILYSFNITHAQDPSIDPGYRAFLKTKCPSTSTNSNRDLPIQLDPTPTHLDNRFPMELTKNRGLLTSD
ncbi:hypothetical protein K2173_008119 [Erythroxylum novogranatense]|uniref:peroxidase n=1 Tax=Erythroxylum novogranatense TaxID=1862640 RepID=A0AAV8S957_9ROSI|nr:hypothetical protein K2173_008119 [Erythroxylum novogranatense]